MTPSWTPKEPHEHLDYGLDFSLWLTPGESINSYDASVESGTVNITSFEMLTNILIVWIEGGKKGELSKILCSITTNAGRILTLTPILPIS